MILILSIDGGGIRGIVPSMILDYIEKVTKKHSTEIFDIFVGTSTGSIIISGLNIEKEGKPKFKSSDILQLYLDKSKIIFKKPNFFQNIMTIFKPKFSSCGIRSVLREYFGFNLMRETIKPCLITTYDIKNGTSTIFKTRNSHGEKDITLFDACMSSTAAPTYLPSYSIEYDGKICNFIDGGVYANNPGMIGVAEVLKWCEDYFHKKVSLNDIKVLSLGTGTYIGPNDDIEKQSYGLLYWASKISDIMMKGVSQTTNYQLSEILPKKNYMRLQIEITDPKRKEMEDSSEENIKYLMKETARQIISDDKKMKELFEFIQNRL